MPHADLLDPAPRTTAEGLQGEDDSPGHAAVPAPTLTRPGAPSPTSPPVDDPATKTSDRWFMILLTVFEVGASILVVHEVKSHGDSDFAAYMWALLPPLLGALVYWLRTRHASGASFAILTFNLLSAAVAFFGSHDSRVLLYKDCFVTGIIAVIFLGSLLLRRPLTFWFGQRFATGATSESLVWWDSLWQHEAFRRMHRQMTLLWGVIMAVEAGAKAFVIANTSFENAYLATQVIPLGAMALGIGLTIVMAQRVRKQARAQREAATGTSV